MVVLVVGMCSFPIKYLIIHKVVKPLSVEQAVSEFLGEGSKVVQEGRRQKTVAHQLFLAPPKSCYRFNPSEKNPESIGTAEYPPFNQRGGKARTEFSQMPNQL